MLFNTVQSAGDFNIDDKLLISCAIVKDTSGRGRVRLTEETVSKKSILTIKNSDNLCLPRSLVVAHAYAVRDKTVLENCIVLEISFATAIAVFRKKQ